jgi:hypothetical protein
VKSWIRIRIKVEIQKLSGLTIDQWSHSPIAMMKIRIRIKVKSWIRIRNHVKIWIRIRSDVMRIRNPVKKMLTQAMIFISNDFPKNNPDVKNA